MTQFPILVTISCLLKNHQKVYSNIILMSHLLFIDGVNSLTRDINQIYRLLIYKLHNSNTKHEALY